MSHLIVGTTEKFDLHEMLDKLCAAHKYLAEHGARAFTRAGELGRSEKWGQSVKRIRVELPSDGRPELAKDAPPEHSITEVYNQCATVERLIDAVKWCLLPASKFSEGLGLVCHPTTSSGKSNQDHDDHDLVVRGASGQLGYFEVSDVASNRDGNFKEGKDLVRLKLLRRVADKRGTFEHDVSSGQMSGCFSWFPKNSRSIYPSRNDLGAKIPIRIFAMRTGANVDPLVS